MEKEKNQFHKINDFPYWLAKDEQSKAAVRLLAMR